MDLQHTACFTGHRAIAHSELPALVRRLDETIARLSAQGVVNFGSGGARGFDLIAAAAVLRAKLTDSAVKLIMVLPCLNQDERWSESERTEYRRILKAADKIVYTHKGGYFNGCMLKRNLHLIRNSGICVAYCKRGSTGTSQTVGLAVKRGIKVLNLAE